MSNGRKSVRLDAYLVAEGYYATAREALGPIMAGQIVVDGVVSPKPGTAIRPGAEIFVRGRRLRYASRGGYKLACALEAFGVEVRDRIVLDAGASTGGFTDCLLQAGCRKVYAVDVGYGQLRGSLAADPRVVNLERTNVSDLSAEIVKDVELCTVDLSYLSLLKAIPIIRERCGPVEMVCLVKPLYEGLAEDSKNDAQAMDPLLCELLRNLELGGHPVTGAVPSPLLGGRGAVEFLIHLTQGKQGKPARAGDELVREAIAALVEQPPAAEVELIEKER